MELAGLATFAPEWPSSKIKRRRKKRERPNPDGHGGIKEKNGKKEANNQPHTANVTTTYVNPTATIPATMM